jgi:integrase
VPQRVDAEGACGGRTILRWLSGGCKAISAPKAANKARVEAELPPLPATRWHDFRHYAVSTLIAQNANILLIARIAGHADPNVTLKVYGHLMENALSDAATLYDPLREVAGVKAG